MRYYLRKFPLCINNEGVYLKELFNNIAVRHGEGISGVQLLIERREIAARYGWRASDRRRSTLYDCYNRLSG